MEQKIPKTIYLVHMLFKNSCQYVSINTISRTDSSLKGKIQNTFMFPTDMSYFNSELLIRTSAHSGLFKLSRMIMSDCVLKVTELETKL